MRMTTTLYILFVGLFLILSCETDEVLDFTRGQESLCPPRDARCCPDNMDKCSIDEMRSAGKCEMSSEVDYGVKKGRCTNEKVCRPVGLDDKVFVFACREQCTESQTACLDINSDATCAHIGTDTNNCGGCFYDGTGSRCTEGVSCVDGVCQLICPLPTVSCEAACVNPENDINNCGGCVVEGRGEKCASGLRCSNGVCGSDCASGFVPCGEVCINPNNDPKNCGGCLLTGYGKVCEDGYRCIEGDCKPFCAVVCKNGGTCSATNTCICTISWIGKDCSMQDRVRIPASGTTTTFVMGRPDSDTWGDGDEQPSHNVTLNAYMMDRYLVTAASYKHCVEAGSCTAAETGGSCTYNAEGKEKHPINCVNWEQAKAYCEWGRRAFTDRGRVGASC
ncbi:MAG: SUMF1/EgtB/PvdO family nonheme iron enzyme [Bradymonadales bacterium]